jgi:hypothetical protein
MSPELTLSNQGTIHRTMQGPAIGALRHYELLATQLVLSLGGLRVPGPVTIQRGRIELLSASEQHELKGEYVLRMNDGTFFPFVFTTLDDRWGQVVRATWHSARDTCAVLRRVPSRALTTGRFWAGHEKARKIGPLLDCGAEEGIRTPTILRSPAPQAGEPKNLVDCIFMVLRNTERLASFLSVPVFAWFSSSDPE